MKLQMYEAATLELDALGDLERDEMFWAKQPVDVGTSVRRGTLSQLGPRSHGRCQLTHRDAMLLTTHPQRRTFRSRCACCMPSCRATRATPPRR